ncbi:MAG: ATP-grasp domain-containing protein [Oscillatoria sp. PMC 1068.18]|nr:ATP-grasp domain-containing protein [Oscillatoria sp. PMC 1076.18]MEC4989080.1 ATP-grasp domain-containing protein [Oscillatoria sp. PMC 1068.18]
MALILFIRGRLSAFFQNLGTLTLLLILFPFNLLLVLPTFLLNLVKKPFQQRVVNNNPQTILLTGGKMTKALQLARSFHNAGHQVILVETHKYWLSGHRFSRSVNKFYTVTKPEPNPEEYCQDLLAIVKKENVDVFIPVSSPVASYYDSLAKQALSPHCEVIHFDAETTKMLDNKYAFCSKAREIGLSAPKVFYITDPEQVINFDFKNDGSQYILKSIPYDSVRRLDLTKLPFSGMKNYVKQLPINQEKPWVMQEFIRGKEYCTHSTARKGKIRLHCCSESSPFQVNYEQIDNPEIYAWVKKFVEELNLTGQISIDFLQAEDGTVYPVECNPRIHSAITMFHDHPGVANAYLADAQSEDEAPIEPLTESKPTYWLYHELWRLLNIRSREELKTWSEKITQGTDAMFTAEDPLPFLMVHHWQIPLLLLQNLLKLKGWIRIDFNIGKLVELGGD